MNKNQALVWVTIIIGIMIYSLNSVVHSKERYLNDIALLKSELSLKIQAIDILKKRGELLTFEALEVSNATEYKKTGNISQKVITLQNDNIAISKIMDRYSNLRIRNQREIVRNKKILLTISTEQEEALFKKEQEKIKKAKKVLVNDKNTSTPISVVPILDQNTTRMS